MQGIRTASPDSHLYLQIAPCVPGVIFAPNDTISAQKCTNSLWASIRGAQKISKKTKQGAKGNTSGIIHRRSYADVAAAPA